jgi:hypothetical protein
MSEQRSIRPSCCRYFRYRKVPHLRKTGDTHRRHLRDCAVSIELSSGVTAIVLAVPLSCDVLLDALGFNIQGLYFVPGCRVVSQHRGSCIKRGRCLPSIPRSPQQCVGTLPWLSQRAACNLFLIRSRSRPRPQDARFAALTPSKTATSFLSRCAVLGMRGHWAYDVLYPCKQAR